MRSEASLQNLWQRMKSTGSTVFLVLNNTFIGRKNRSRQYHPVLSVSVSRGKNLYVGNYGFLYANKPCIIKRGIVSTP